MYAMYSTVEGMMGDRGARRGSVEVLILALVAERSRHGYEIAKLIEERSDGALAFHVASLYPTLYRLERGGLIVGRWLVREGERRRRFYRLTPAGEEVLAAQRQSWGRFVSALSRVAGIRHTR
jgi:PadR family transcriptional regulator PadR